MQASIINMAEALLARGRELWDQERSQEAVSVLSRLLNLREIPVEIAERAEFYLGDIQLGMGHYRKARRHLAAAIANGSSASDTYFLMGCALDWDDEPDVQTAYRHYRRAVELEPGQPLYSSTYALTRIRRRPEGRKYDREALQRLRAAFAAEPDDADIVHNYVSGLIEMGRANEAEIALRRARKRWPGHPAFEELWHEFLDRTDQLPRRRAAPGFAPRLRVVPADDAPVLLPFPTPKSSAPQPRRVPTLRPNARLKRALESLDADQVDRIAERLELAPGNDPGDRRQLVQSALLDRDQLAGVFRNLSVGSRHLVQVLVNAGGHATVKELRLRVDSPADIPAPHFNRGGTARPLDELAEVGIVFRTSAGDGSSDADVAMIPNDLRKLLREVISTS